MDKCWFVLQQAHYQPPQYASPTKALGKTTAGDLRLGDAVTSPTALYPLLTQGVLPKFSVNMRITSTQLCDFEWQSNKARENSGSAGVSAPIATSIGATLGAELSREVKNTVEDWAKLSSLETEIVQPSREYINKVIELPDVQDYIDHHKKAHFGQWTIYIITGLMIARTSGTIGHSEAKERGFGGGPEVDLVGAVTANANLSHSSSESYSRFASFEGDRVWAVRFAKVHKGFLRSKWMQTEEREGAALDDDIRSSEDVGEVLKHEGLNDVQIANMAEDPTLEGGQQLVLVKGCFDC